MSYTHTPWHPYAPPRDKCEKHPGVKWNGDTPCFVCYPTQEAEGTTQYEPSLVPDPTQYIRPAVRQCVVLPKKDSDAICGRPISGDRTVLGFGICDACYEAVREP